jgi:hypothetical protein
LLWQLVPGCGEIGGRGQVRRISRNAMLAIGKAPKTVRLYADYLGRLRTMKRCFSISFPGRRPR